MRQLASRKRIPGLRRSIALVALGVLAAPTATAEATDGVPKHLAFSTYLGGERFDFATDVAIDGSGNAYLVGTTDSAAMLTKNAAQPIWGGIYPNPEVLAPIPNRRQDAFVVKIAPSGAILYATYLGGSSTDAGTAIAVDPAGYAYVTGVTYSVDFPTKNAYRSTPDTTDAEVFLTKYAPDGTVVWSTYFGGAAGVGLPDYTAQDLPTGIAIDDLGRPVVVGATASPVFPTTPNAGQAEFGGGYSDGWIAIFSADGKTLEYSSYLGGTQDDSAAAVAVAGLAPADPGAVGSPGRILVAGKTNSTDFPVTADAYDATMEGTHQPEVVSEAADAFVVAIPAGGGPVRYGTFVGGGEGEYVMPGWYSLPEEQVTGVAVGPEGRVYVAGYTQSSDFPATSGAFQRTLQDKQDAALFEGGDGYVFALSPSGRSLEYATYFGAESTDFITGLAVDPSGRAHLTGFTSSFGFPISTEAYQPRRANEGRRDTYNQAVCNGPGGPVIGEILGEQFCDDTGMFLLGDGQDGFMSILDAQGANVEYSTYLGGWQPDSPYGIGLAPDGSVLVAGSTDASDFPARRAAQPVNAGLSEGTLTRFSPVAPPPCTLELGPICLNV